MNLLDHFYLQHVRVTQLSGELVPPRESTDEREAKVELNLSPRPLKTADSTGRCNTLVKSFSGCFEV